jgi:ADP-ribose pyrophosphatase
MDQPEVLLTSQRFRVVRHRWLGRRGQEVVKDTIEHPGAVVLLPLLSDGRVVLIENHRVAIGQTLLELPAGTREPNEAPQITAGRELEEETGYSANHIELMREFYVSPGILNERMFLYRATGLTAGDQRLEAGEQIVTKLLPWDEALALVDSGQICDAKTIIALLHEDRQRRGRLTITPNV